MPHNSGRGEELARQAIPTCVVTAGPVLLLEGSFIQHDGTKFFVQAVGSIIGAVGLAGWLFSSAKG